jgi:cytochrome b
VRRISGINRRASCATGVTVPVRQGVSADPMEQTNDPRVRIWDLPTRLFHWALAACVVFSLVTGQIGGNAMAWHLKSGYTIAALLVFRLLWGFVGGRWSRFASFVYPPRAVLRYLRGGSRPDEYHDVGHSPIGALSVFAMLGFLALQVSTGLIADDEIATTGPLARYVSGATSSLATGYHKNIGQPVLITLVLLHVGAVLYYLFRRRRNLIAPMWGGDKRLPGHVPAARDDHATRGIAVALFVVCAIAVGWLVSLGG